MRHIIYIVLAALINIISDITIILMTVAIVALWIPYVFICVIIRLIMAYKRHMQFLFTAVALGATVRKW